MPLSLGIASGAGSLKNPAEAKALGYSINLVKNPSFETDTAGWSAVPGGSILRVTNDSQYGSACLEVTNSSGSAAEYSPSGKIALEGTDTVYQISAYVKLTSPTATGNYFLRHLQYETEDGEFTVAAGNVGTQTLSDSDGWVRLTGSFTKVGTGNYAVVRLGTANTVAGATFLVDGFLVEKAASLGDYFDGDTDGFWTGTPHASESGATPY